MSRVIKKWAIIWPVDFSNNVNKTYWVFFAHIMNFKNINIGMIGKKELAIIGNGLGSV